MSFSSIKISNCKKGKIQGFFPVFFPKVNISGRAEHCIRIKFQMKNISEGYGNMFEVSYNYEYNDMICKQ